MNLKKKPIIYLRFCKKIKNIRKREKRKTVTIFESNMSPSHTSISHHEIMKVKRVINNNN